MSIVCKICNTTFPKIIPWQHLKKHNISTADYKKQHGKVYGLNTLEKFKSRIPHNKGKKVTDPVHLSHIKTAMAKREERFQNKEFTRGYKKTNEQKEVLRQRTTEYAKNNPTESVRRARKAVNTKIAKGFDFGSPNRGKKHSEKTKSLISIKSKQAASLKSALAQDRICRLLFDNQMTLLSLTDNIATIQCHKCNTIFAFTTQYFTPSKFHDKLCVGCFPRIPVKQSQAELELYEFVKSICSDAVSGWRKSYHSKEIDIFVPSKK